jgi:hypothetical protein
LEQHHTYSNPHIVPYEMCGTRTELGSGKRNHWWLAVPPGIMSFSFKEHFLPFTEGSRPICAHNTWIDVYLSNIHFWLFFVGSFFLKKCSCYVVKIGLKNPIPMC